MSTHYGRTFLFTALLAAASAAPVHAAPGGPLGPAFGVNTVTLGEQQQASVALDGSGNFAIVWESNDGSLSGVFAQRFAADGTRRGAPFRVNTHTDNRQGAPDVAMDAAGNFVVAWRSSGQDGSGTGIYAQRYDADGNPAGGEFLVNTRTEDSQVEPQVAMNASGQFVIAWSDRALAQGSDADRRMINTRAYAADGVPRLSSQQEAETAFGPRVLNPALGMADDGRFVVAWFRDGSPNSIYARRFKANGKVQGYEFLVASAATDLKLDLPALAMNGAGEFVVTWEATRPDGSRAGLYGRRYTSQSRETQPAAGAAGVLGPVFRIDENPLRLGRSSVAMDAAGTFTVAGDADGKGIYIRRFDSLATPLGPASVVATRRYSPFQARVAAAPDGNFVVSWHSFQQDGAGRGVFARRFQGP